VKIVVARLEDFPPGERKIVKAGSRSIGVFRVEDDFFAIRNRCPHQGGPLCIGRLSPWAIADGPGQVRMDGPPRLVACPWHGWEYDLETGQSFMGPGETRVKAYDVSVARGDTLDEDVRPADEQKIPIPPAARAAGREPGPYVAETFSVYVEEDYVVVDV
jgi:nitrite reductase/ring-hydroxylating ferredoxin subunit